MAGRRRDRDEDFGLTPREWLDSDPVPLTPDIDFDDPEQRIAWIRANNEEMYQRDLELQARRDRARDGARDDERDGAGPTSSTTVVAVRLQNAEQRALVRAARREDVTVSDLVRRWVRAGLAAALEPDERAEGKRALEAAADAVVERIGDELRRLREIVAGAG